VYAKDRHVRGGISLWLQDVDVPLPEYSCVTCDTVVVIVDFPDKDQRGEIIPASTPRSDPRIPSAKTFDHHIPMSSGVASATPGIFPPFPHV